MFLKSLATALAASLAAVTLAAGQTSRIKTLEIAGDGPALAEALAALAG